MMEHRNAKEIYADIIDLPHHQSDTRPHMSLYDRAAQFAPFAALAGYDEMIAEEGRLTEMQTEPAEEQKALLDLRLEYIRDLTERGEHPSVSFTYFLPDGQKAGGSYVTVTGRVKKLDLLNRTVVLYGSGNTEDRRIPVTEIPVESIAAIDGEIFWTAA